MNNEVSIAFRRFKRLIAQRGDADCAHQRDQVSIAFRLFKRLIVHPWSLRVSRVLTVSIAFRLFKRLIGPGAALHARVRFRRNRLSAVQEVDS